MARVRGCDFPDALWYLVEENLWLRPEPDGSVTLGVTAYACALSGEIVSFLPKPTGRRLDAGQSFCTLESGKWVGALKTPCVVFVESVNATLDEHPDLINRDPYGTGWLVRLRPEGDVIMTAAVSGEIAWAAFEDRMEQEGFEGCR